MEPSRIDEARAPETAATQVSEAAAKEYNIEQTLDTMLGDWTGLELQIFPYRDTGTGVLKGVDEVQVRDSVLKLKLNLNC